MQPKNQLIDHLFRHQSGKMASILIGMHGFRNASIIEDAIQDTFVAALKLWSMKGVPSYPEAWLMKVARNKTINELKRIGRHQELNIIAIQEKNDDEPNTVLTIEDEKFVQLKALFGCCNPLLSVKAQIMTTLKYVCGFGDKEIARALFMEPSAVRKAIYRTKNTLKDHQNYFLELSDLELKQRLTTVEMVLYLMFNEGYSASSGAEELNVDISFEALRLTEWILDKETISEASTHALFALMLFQFARFEARLIDKDIPTSIEEQDRSLWNQTLIKKGLHHQKLSRQTEVLTRFHIECGIAAIHCTAKSYDETQWDQIVALYRQLLPFDDSIPIQTNLAIALCEQGNTKESNQLLQSLISSASYDFPVLFAALGRVHEKKGEFEQAKSYYTVAKEHSKTRFEKNFMAEKLLQLTLRTIHCQN